MEFERIKLINQYKVDPPAKTSEQGEPPEPVPEGEEKPVYIDYM